MSGSGGPPIQIGESPYRKESITTVHEEREFEICNIKDKSAKSPVLRREKLRFIHLKEDDDGLYWNILIIPHNGEPQNYVLREEDAQDVQEE